LDSLEVFERAQELAQEFGLHFQVEHGPKEVEPNTLEGVRIVTIWGLPQKMSQMQQLLGVSLMKSTLQRQKDIHKLYRSFDISP
jgi:hypothetical protein